MAMEGWKCPFWGKYSGLFSGANLLLVFGEFLSSSRSWKIGWSRPKSILTMFHGDSFCNTCNWKTQVSNNDRSNIPANVIQESWKQRARFWDFADLAVVVHQDININRILPNPIAFDTPECVYLRCHQIANWGDQTWKLDKEMCDFEGFSWKNSAWSLGWCHIMTSVTKWTNQPTSYPPENY